MHKFLQTCIIQTNKYKSHTDIQTDKNTNVQQMYKDITMQTYRYSYKHTYMHTLINTHIYIHTYVYMYI